MLLSAEGEDSDKHLEVAAEEWLKARNDIMKRTKGITWKTLIDDLKRFLLLNPKINLHAPRGKCLTAIAGLG